MAYLNFLLGVFFLTNLCLGVESPPDTDSLNHKAGLNEVELGRAVSIEPSKRLEQFNKCPTLQSSTDGTSCKYLAYLILDELNKTTSAAVLEKKINELKVNNEELKEPAKKSLLDLFKSRFEKEASSLLKEANEKPNSLDRVWVDLLRNKDPRVNFLVEKFPLSLDHAIHFLKAIERDPKSAGKALSELFFSLTETQRKALLEEINDIKLAPLDKNKPPFNEYPDFARSFRFLHYWNNDKKEFLADPTLPPLEIGPYDDFKTAFLSQRTDKLKANEEYGKLIDKIITLDEKESLSKEELETRKTLNKDLNERFGKMQPAFFRFNSLNSSASTEEKANGAKQLRAYATINTDKKYEFHLDASYAGYNSDKSKNAGGKQRILLSKSPEEILTTFSRFDKADRNLDERPISGTWLGIPSSASKNSRILQFGLVPLFEGGEGKYWFWDSEAKKAVLKDSAVK